MTSLPELGYTFSATRLLEEALTHKSFFNENPSTCPSHNERLEFLGDSVLDLVISSLLMETYPALEEGALSKIRASLVNESSLAKVAKTLKLESFMRLGRGELKMKGANKPRLQASCFEALVGAIFLDGGYSSAYQWLKNIFVPSLSKINFDDFFETDYKTSLQEVIQKSYKVTPKYELIKEEGPDHEKIFYSQISVDGLFEKMGCGKSKKASEQDAAKKVLEAMI